MIKTALTNKCDEIYNRLMNDLLKKTLSGLLQKLEIFINNSVRLKILMHDSGFYIIKKARERRIRARYGVTPFPRYVSIETCTLCNAGCKTCFRAVDKTRSDTIIDEALFKKIVKECSVHKPSLVRLSSTGGEPLMDPGLVEKIRYARNSGIRYIDFATNASLLDEKISLELIKSGLGKIVISLDGATKETYEKMRPGLDFDTVIKNVRNFIRLKRSLGSGGPAVQINFVRTKFNFHEWEELKRIWSGSADSVTAWPFWNMGGSYGAPGMPSFKRRSPCCQLWNDMSVFVNGKVPLCCIMTKDEVVIGDAARSSLSEVWSSEVLNKIRQAHLDGRFDEVALCDRCDRWRFAEGRPWYY